MSDRIDTTGPLPAKVTTKQFIPPAHDDQYVRTMEGDWRLDYVNADDLVNVAAHQDAIARGEVRVLPAGWTSETEKLNAEEQAAQTQRFHDELKRLQTEEAARRTAALEARIAKLGASMRAQYQSGNLFIPPGERR